VSNLACVKPALHLDKHYVTLYNAVPYHSTCATSSLLSSLMRLNCKTMQLCNHTRVNKACSIYQCIALFSQIFYQTMSNWQL